MNAIASEIKLPHFHDRLFFAGFAGSFAFCIISVCGSEGGEEKIKSLMSFGEIINLLWKRELMT